MGKWTRRGFITAGVLAGGALAIGVGIRPGDLGPKVAKYVADENEVMLTAWVKLAKDNTITAIVPHSEMGQGVLTALGAMLAEEMDADWDRLEIIEAPAEKEYSNFILAREFLVGDKDIPNFLFDTVNGVFLKLSQAMIQQITGGSLSVRTTGVGGMQTAGAAARELLMKAAAKDWGVKVADIRTEKSYLYHDASGRSAPYGEFAEAAAEFEPTLQPKLKPRSEYTLMGTPLPRRDIPSKVDGSANFAVDITVPGMKYATVKAAPVLGNRVAKMDAKAAKSMPGVIGVYNMGDCVAVVADGYWQAKQALDAVDITFEKTEKDAVQMDGIYAQYEAALDGAAKAKTHHKQGNVGEAMASAASTFEAQYQVPFLAHACMEPMTAVAHVQDGQCDLWVGTQNPLGTRMATAKTLDMKLDNVTVHNQFLGGGFGRRSETDYTDQAVLISQKSGHPVKLIWSREEDVTHDHYRPSAISRFKAGLDDQGMPIAWDKVFVHQHDPKEASLVFYNIDNQDIRFVESPTHIRFGPWRSVDHTQHGFYTESFIDELAHNAGKDGYEYRRALLKDKPNHIAVLDAAAKGAGWGKTLPEGVAQGIAITESFGTIVAQVATVDVNGDEPRVTHVSCAADAGFAVNPDGFSAQMESGIIYGLTAALYGEITITDGAVDQSNFHDYQMIRMDNAPDIDVIIINSDRRVGGAGEPGTPTISPAVTNAIFAATGTRIRELPVMNHELGGRS